ncbi:MAG TPA: hypothetical protein VGV90_05580 [Solirubrobacteraceae bacterium]|nr:hypothetical protein [Solirubrobacteraceae bacterium]
MRYLVKNKELTGARLLRLHNLAYVARLMAGLRDAIVDGTLNAGAAALCAGAAP